MHVPTPPPNAEAMTPAERLAYLRSRGVAVDVVRDMTRKKPTMPVEEAATSASVPPPAPTLDDDEEDALTPDQRARVGRLSSSADPLRTVEGLEGVPIARAPWIAVRRRSKARSRSASAPAARITDGLLIAGSRPLSMQSLGDLSDSD